MATMLYHEFSALLRECFDDYFRREFPQNVNVFIGTPRKQEVAMSCACTGACLMGNGCAGCAQPAVPIQVHYDDRLQPDEWKIITDPLPVSTVHKLMESQVEHSTQKLLEVTELLVKKEAQIGEIERRHRQELVGRAAAMRALQDQVQAGAKLIIEHQEDNQHLTHVIGRLQGVIEHWMLNSSKSNDLLLTFREIVLDLFDKTSDRGVYNACKAALDAYEEGMKDAAQRTAEVYGIAPMAKPADADGSDREQAQRARVAGSERDRERDRANRAAQACFDGIQQWDISEACVLDTSEHTTKLVYGFQAEEAETLEELLGLVKVCAARVRKTGKAISWRSRPKVWSETNFNTDKKRWYFYCRYLLGSSQLIEKIARSHLENCAQKATP
jgi:hypothetical protein